MPGTEPTEPHRTAAELLTDEAKQQILAARSMFSADPKGVRSLDIVAITVAVYSSGMDECPTDVFTRELRGATGTTERVVERVNELADDLLPELPTVPPPPDYDGRNDEDEADDLEPVSRIRERNNELRRLNRVLSSASPRLIIQIANAALDGARVEAGLPKLFEPPDRSPELRPVSPAYLKGAFRSFADVLVGKFSKCVNTALKPLKAEVEGLKRALSAAPPPAMRFEPSEEPGTRQASRGPDWVDFATFADIDPATGLIPASAMPGYAELAMRRGGALEKLSLLATADLRHEIANEKARAALTAQARSETDKTA